MESERKSKTPSAALLSAWEDVKGVLALFVSMLRAEEGCEEVEVTLCLRNGSRMDTYHIPCDKTRGPVGDIADENLMERSKTQRINDQTEKGSKEESCDISGELLSCINGYSIKQLRHFFTTIRKTMKLSTFDWPEIATTKYLACRRGPVPSAPGRANSGKDALLFMLKLSVQHDQGWRAAVKQELKHSHPDMFDSSAGSCDSRSEPPKDLASKNRNDKGNVAHSQGSGSCSEDFDHTKSSLESRNSGTEGDEKVDTMVPSEVIELARRLPSDNTTVLIAKRAWVSLHVLLSYVRYPNVKSNNGWFIQYSPGDGNCMFSAILVAAKSFGCLPSNLESVQSMRKYLRTQLKELSRAGLWNSGYRRDLLASCLYEVENDDLREYLRKAMEKTLSSHSDLDMERFLAPLRIILSNWADMVGGYHWGGMFRVEMSIIATACNAVIEVLQPNVHPPTGICSSIDLVEMCDTRNGDRRVSLERRDLIYPTYAVLPSPDQHFLGPFGLGNTDSGWLGRFPVLRVVLNNRHYSACTSKYGYPICPHPKNGASLATDTWFKHSDTLIEPYCSLSVREKSYYNKAIGMIKIWREACANSEMNGRHADALVMQVRNTDLSVSMLSHLEVPYPENAAENPERRESFLMSDELVTCYMHLLQMRAELLRQSSDTPDQSKPPKCMYMDSWFFKSIYRGLSGPSSKKKRAELLSYSLIILPALVDGHWMLGLCYVKDGIIAIYDPLGMRRPNVFNAIRNWLHAQFPGGEKMTWTYHQVEETRYCKQIGTIDCGVYVCKAAESLGLGIPLRLSQADIPYVRRRMLMEFMRQEASKIRWPR